MKKERLILIAIILVVVVFAFFFQDIMMAPLAQERANLQGSQRLQRDTPCKLPVGGSCGSEEVLRNGCCVHAQCDDSDGGQNPLVAGFVTQSIEGEGNPLIEYDTCMSSDTVMEQYCSGAQIKQAIAPCGANSLCEEGACVSQLEPLPAHCIPIKYTGNLATSVNLVFVGSNFAGNKQLMTQEILRAQSQFAEQAVYSEEIGELNIFYVDLEASDIFGGSFNSFCTISGRILSCPNTIALPLSAVCYSGERQTVVVHKEARYGGRGYTGLDIATTTTHEDAPRIALHEVGHSLFTLADEYNGNHGSVYSNCDTVGCNKWSDMIGYEGVGCVPNKCQGSAFFTGEVSIMEFLDYPFEEVNERIACCTYKDLTGSYPASLCSRFVDFGQGLDAYCTTVHSEKTISMAEAWRYEFAKENGGWKLISEKELAPGRINRKYLESEDQGIRFDFSSAEGVKTLYLDPMIEYEIPGEYPALGGYQKEERDYAIIVVPSRAEQIFVDGLKVR